MYMSILGQVGIAFSHVALQSTGVIVAAPGGEGLVLLRHLAKAGSMEIAPRLRVSTRA